ncbi:MAG: GNAT family N-acetyltransferase [Limibacillus sp.]
MSSIDPVLRPARREDAALIARLVNRAAEGLPKLLWRDMAEAGEDPWDVGERRAVSEDAAISYRHTWIAEMDGQAAGCLITHEIPANPNPIPEDELPMFIPLLELENEAPETRYVYVLSTLKEMRGKGVGSTLLRHAEQFRGPKGMSLIVSDANLGARRLYERHGYREANKRPMVKIGWDNPGEHWVLMTKL